MTCQQYVLAELQSLEIELHRPPGRESPERLSALLHSDFRVW